MAPVRKLMSWVFLFVSCLVITCLAENEQATSTPQTNTNQAGDTSEPDQQEQQTKAPSNSNKPDQQQQDSPSNTNKPDQQQQQQQQQQQESTQDPSNPNQGATNAPGNLNQGAGGGPPNNQATRAPDNSNGTSTNNSANSTKPHLLNDTTDFVLGLNGWDLSGLWGKVDLLQLPNATRPLPLVPDAADQEVFICHPWIVPSYLEKTFPALSNGTLSLVYHVAAPNKDINMTGEVLETRDGGTGITVYNYTFPEDLMEHNNKWIRQDFKLPNITTKGEFKVRLSIQWGKTALWAAGSVGVVGEMIPPTPPPPPPTEITTTPTNTTGEVPLTTPDSVNASQAVNATTETPINGTQPSVNGTQAPVNGTDTPVNATESSNGTAVVPGGGTDQPSTTLDPNHPAAVGQLAGVAQAIWDAFYVFLALFCACLVALVALIVHGRCKNDEPPPTVATYNPRTSSYRLDKVYDNPSYDNHAV